MKALWEEAVAPVVGLWLGYGLVFVVLVLSAKALWIAAQAVWGWL